MGSAMNSGQFVRNKSTGQLGVTTVDPYGICAPGEVAITFTDSSDPDQRLGNGYPVGEWEVVADNTLTDAERTKFAWARTARTRAA